MKFIEKYEGKILILVILIVSVPFAICSVKFFSDDCNIKKESVSIDGNYSKNNKDEIMLVVNGNTQMTINDYFYQEMPRLLSEKYTKFESKDLVKLPAAVKLANVEETTMTDSLIFEFQPTKDPLDFLYGFQSWLMADGKLFREKMNHYVYFKGSWYVENEYKKVISKQDAIKELNVFIRSFNNTYDDKKEKEESWKKQ